MSTAPLIAATDLEELRAVVRTFLEDKSPVTRALEVMESVEGHDHNVWRQLCDQLELPALAIPERYGGQGFGFRELAVALEELGRVAYTGPFFATAVLAASALVLASDEEACSEYLPRIATGDCTGTLAAFEPGGEWSLDCRCTTAALTDGVWRIDGVKDLVLDGDGADLLIVTARCEEDIGLFAVDGRDPGVEATPLPVLDLTRPIATLRLNGVTATRIGGEDAGRAVLPAVLDRALAGLACEQAGATQACLEMTVTYASERFQFGRPIGSYQAVRHRCADMFVLAESARATARNAARALAEEDPDSEVAVGVAKSYCSDAFLTVADAAIQLHGGIAFTWEHPAHVYFKRAKASALMFGDPALHRVRIAPRLLDTPTPEAPA